MYNAQKGNKSIKELVVNNCWQYLYNNFHKFNQTNKIKIALELAKKDLPTQLQGELKITEMPTAKIGGRIDQLLPLELNIGEPTLRASGNPSNAGEAPTSLN